VLSGDIGKIARVPGDKGTFLPGKIGGILVLKVA
jgi:hypothetical protein